MLKAKLEMLYPDIPKSLPQHPVASVLGIEPTEEIATVMKEIGNTKAVEPDGLPVELLYLGLPTRQDHPAETPRLTALIWRERKSHSSGKTWSIPYSTRRTTRRKTKTTAASLSCQVLLKAIVRRLSAHCEAKRLLPD